MQRKTYKIDKQGTMVYRGGGQHAVKPGSGPYSSIPTGTRCIDAVTTVDTLVSSVDESYDEDIPPNVLQQATSRVRGMCRLCGDGSVLLGIV